MGPSSKAERIQKILPKLIIDVTPIPSGILILNWVETNTSAAINAVKAS